MSLSTATLAQLARKRAGIGPVRTAQDGSPFAAFPTAAPAASGDGVDTSSAVLANLIVTPTGGDATFTLLGRSAGAADWQELDGWKEIVAPAGISTKYRVRCESEDELHAQLTAATTAASVTIAIEPCNG